MSPILRIKFLLHIWLSSNIPIEQITETLEKQMSEGVYECLLKKYQVVNFYNSILTSMNSTLSTYTSENQKILFAKRSTPLSKLFFLAMAIVIAFDSADLTCPGKCFRFESLLDDETASTFLNYITDNNITPSGEFLNHYKIYMQNIKKLLGNIGVLTLGKLAD